ncbi:hypothetical protein ABZ691_30080 [Streptomyces sp. NPDC006854]|uniref:hypothetical protein n=1 Tax=Streptomyces sp. NPDC006854 TaxID=3155115 RepID=UPI0033DF12DB
MASTKTTYSTTHPTTGKPVTFTKGGRPIRWITWGDLGSGFVHIGFSSQEDYKKAVRAPRSSNPYASRYEATAATVVEDKPAEQPQQEPGPAPVAEKAPAPVVTPADVAELLDRIATSYEDDVRCSGLDYLGELVIQHAAHGVPHTADEDTFAARRAELRADGRLPHVKAIVAHVREALTNHLGRDYNRSGGASPARVRAVAELARLAAQFPVGEVAVRLPDGDEKRRDVVVVLAAPDQEGKVQVHSVAANGQVRVPLTELRPAPELPPEPEGEITDWWTITDANGAELTRVQAESDPAARKAAMRDSKVVAACRRDNGFAVRPLRSSELSTPVGELHGMGRTAQPATPARTVTVTTGFTRKSIPTRLRESGAPGRMVNSDAAGGALRWRLPNGEELTPGEAEAMFLR